MFYLIYLVEFLFYHEISLKNRYKKLNCIYEIAIFKHNIQYYLKYFFTEPVLFIIYKSDYYYYSQIHIIYHKYSHNKLSIRASDLIRRSTR